MSAVPVSFNYYDGDTMYEVWAMVFRGTDPDYDYPGDPPSVDEMQVFLNGELVQPDSKLQQQLDDRAIEEYVFYM